MKLPNGDRAEVSPSRLQGYLLNSKHPVGKHKARVFASALGLDATAAEELRAWLLAHAREGDATPGLADEHGQRFVMIGKMLYKGREAVIRSAWIVRAGRDFPEFLTAYVE